MNEYESIFISDANADNFAQKVLVLSEEQPVLVDFWADWCAPCQVLMPVLATLAEEYQGKFLLVKVNSDQEQELAMKYGVRSLPTVKVFRHGEIVDEFVGALTESQVRLFLDKHIEHESDRAVTEAAQLHEQGESEAAIDLLRQAVAAGTANDQALIRLAQILIDQGELSDIDEILRGAGRETRESPEYAQLKSRLQFGLQSQEAPQEEELQKQLEENPADCRARLQMGALLVSRQAYEEAMELYLEIVRRDRNFENDAGRKALLDIFKLLGAADARVQRYQRLLALALN